MAETLDEQLVARVRGDGRTYQMRLGTEARYRGMEVYIHFLLGL